MTQKQFDRAVDGLLKDFASKLRQALAIKSETVSRKAVRALKTEWKEEHGTYYVGQYTVKSHFRKIPARS